MTSWNKGTNKREKRGTGGGNHDQTALDRFRWVWYSLWTTELNSWRLNLCLFNEAKVLFIDFLPFLSVTHNYRVVSMRWSWHSAPPWHTQFTKTTHIYPYIFPPHKPLPHTNCRPFLWHTFRTGGRMKSLLFARVSKNATLIPQVVSPW